MLSRTLEPEVMDTAEEAADYDSMDHADVNRRFVDDLITMLGSPVHLPAGDVVDLGTGTALIPIELAERSLSFSPILACDLSMEMLKLAQQHLQQRSLCDRVSTIYCDVKQLPLPDSSCRLIISNSIIHHIPNPEEMFHEVRRIAAPGAAIFFRDLMRPNSALDVDKLVEQHARQENEHQQKMFRESLHAALTVDEMSRMLQRCGLSDMTVQATSDRHWTASGYLTD